MKNLSVSHLKNFLERYEKLAFLENKIIEAANLICGTAKNKNLLLLCGNGGSAADSEHMAAELLKSFILKREAGQDLKNSLCNLCGAEEGNFISRNLQTGLRCVPLVSFSAFNTAYINDCNPEMIFAQLVNSLGVSNDILIAFSTSGNSANVCYAAKVAKAKGLKVIAFTGESGGKLKDYADVLLNAPSKIVYQIQEYHLPLYHIICLLAESELFDF